MNFGGTYVAMEFSEMNERDVIRLLAIADKRVGDFLSALAVVTGVPLADYELVQFLETTPGQNHRPYVFFFSLAANSWGGRITDGDVQSVRALLLHWVDGAVGTRLRRAAHYYSLALRRSGSLDAFQSAWIGLEVLEPPLARERGTKPGVEVRLGKCEECGFEYEAKRSVLAAVRSFVSGEFHDEAPDLTDWRRLHELRNELSHGLADPENLEARAAELLPAALHYLHDGIVHLAHAHELEVEPFIFVGGEYLWLMSGFLDSEVPPSSLDKWGPYLSVEGFTWQEHEIHGHVPFMQIGRSGDPGDLYTQVLRVDKPLSVASEEDTVAFLTENPGAPVKRTDA